MRLRMTGRFDVGGTGRGERAEAPLFAMFHGYGNDEREMIRIIDAVYAGSDAAGAHGGLPREAEYCSFRGTFDRPYMGGHYWYPDGCGVGERRRACSEVGDAVAALFGSPAFASRRIVAVGFSQGGYLAYRMVVAHPALFDAAILLSPSFRGEEDADPSLLADDRCRTRFLLAYGELDRVIPSADQSVARRVLEATGRLVLHRYPGMGHAIDDAEIADIRAFLGRR